MNKELIKQIVLHIFYGFSILPSKFINNENSVSLRDSKFRFNEKLIFYSEEDEIKNNIYGCQLYIEGQTMNILLGDCSVSEKEYCLLVSLKDSPYYGLYLSNNPSICFSMDGEVWSNCSTYLQATFLAGMEQLRESRAKWNKCDNEDLVKTMKKFIEYKYSEEETNEGQES